MKTATFELTGNAPLIMQSDALADPLNEIAKAIKQITAKQKKTDEDHSKIGKLEFRGGLYYDDTVGPYIPARNVERMLRDAGALSKLGKKVKMGLQVLEDMMPLHYARQGLLRSGLGIRESLLPGALHPLNRIHA